MVILKDKPLYNRWTTYRLFIGVLLVLAYFAAGIVLLVALNLPSTPSKDEYVKPHERAFSAKKANKHRMTWCKSLNFMPKTGRPKIALASFPGSGNTWLRYVLQQATGFNTGSVYKDYGLLKNGFPGEGIANSSVTIIKTHERGQQTFQEFDKAVLLVRDPSDAIMAEFNRQGGGHIGYAPPYRFKLRKGKFWANFVEENLHRWKDTNLDWIANFTGPKLVLFYEDLVNDLETNLKELIKFIELPVVESNIECAMRRREGIYRRKKKVTTDPFTPEMKEKLAAVKEKVYSDIHRFIKNHKSVKS